MNRTFYSLPFDFDALMNQREHSKCSLAQSVEQHLHLILTTAYGELPGEEDFGCSIWEHDFDNTTSGHKLKELIKQSLLKSVKQYEHRLNSVRIELLVREEELTDNMKGRSVKKRIDITITGILHSTNENFIYSDSFYTGPLSYQSI